MRNRYLETLNLQTGATERDIKRAYRRLAKQYHPDRSSLPDAEERFVEIATAYRFLTEVGPTPHHESVRYDYDPYAAEYEQRRQEAYEFGQQRAAERYRARIIATRQVNTVLKIVILLVALFEMLLIYDHWQPSVEYSDQIVDISFNHFHMTGQYEKVILHSRVFHADYKDAVEIEIDSPVTMVVTPLLGIARYLRVDAGSYNSRVYPTYSVYQGYRFMITLILIYCTVFALPFHP